MSRGCGTSISRRFDGAHITTNKDRYIACSDILLTKQLHIRCLDHCIRGFNGTDESLGLNHLAYGIGHVVQLAVSEDAVHVHKQKLDLCRQFLSAQYV